LAIRFKLSMELGVELVSVFDEQGVIIPVQFKALANG